MGYHRTSDDFRVLLMAKNQETLFRHWHLLRLIPRQPQKITVKSIANVLNNEGLGVTERTIQRDLLELSSFFSLVVDDRDKPFGWSWQRDARSFDLPGMTLNEALAWVMLEQHLHQMLPSTTVDHLKPYFSSAHQRLKSESSPKRSRSWIDKIRILPSNQPLISPHIDPHVQKTVSEALFNEQRLEIRYRKKNESEPVVYKIHPLALIQRGNVLYLYARLFDYPNARSLAMHRIEQVEPLDEPAVYPNDFDLDECVNRGVWGFGGEQQCELAIRFYERKGEHLYETPLASNQQLQVDDEAAGILTVRATVPDTPQLRWWILGFGDCAEVLAPASLRHELSQMIARMGARYVVTAETALSTPAVVTSEP